MAPASGVFVQLFAHDRFRDGAVSLVERFERDVVAPPTHWASVAGLRDRYSRPAVEAYLARARDEDGPPLVYLKRTVFPRYVATFAARDEFPAWLTIESDLALREEDPRLLAEFAERIAAGLRLDFGLLDVAFDGMTSDDEMNPDGHEHAPTFADSGPSTIYGRNFLGAARCLALGGLEALSSYGFTTRAASNGVAVCDVLPEPWTRDPRELKAAQRAILTNLHERAPDWATRTVAR